MKDTPEWAYIFDLEGSHGTGEYKLDTNILFLRLGVKYRLENHWENSHLSLGIL